VAFWANMSSLYQNKGLDELYTMVPKYQSEIKLYHKATKKFLNLKMFEKIVNMPYIFYLNTHSCKYACACNISGLRLIIQVIEVWSKILFCLSCKVC